MTPTNACSVNSSNTSMTQTEDQNYVAHDAVALAQAGMQRLEEAMAFLYVSIRNARFIRARQPETS